MKLSDTACRTAKPQTKPYKLSDGWGMFLLVMPNSSKLWRLSYRFSGRQKQLSLGAYPQTGLRDARDKRDAYRRLLESGIDPSQARQAERRQTVINSDNTFEGIAREWYAHNKDSWADRYAENHLSRLEADVFPEIGNMPITSIKPPHLLNMLRKIEGRGVHEIAIRALRTCGQIFRYAVVTGRAETDPSHLLRGALKPYEKKSFPALEAKNLPAFLAKLNSNDIRAYPASLRATKLLMLTFVRTGELIGAKRSEIDLEAKMWTIPAERMKMDKDHIVPLSRQAIALIEEQMAAGSSEWLFPNMVKPAKHMSNNTILDVLKRMGYKGEMTGHGFRALAMSTIKEKLGYRHEVVDRQLAHTPRGVDKAYDRAKFLPERAVMMQEWADYLDGIVAGGKVLAFKMA